jgi:hypothetical protein
VFVERADVWGQEISYYLALGLFLCRLALLRLRQLSIAGGRCQAYLGASLNIYMCVCVCMCVCVFGYMFLFVYLFLFVYVNVLL